MNLALIVGLTLLCAPAVAGGRAPGAAPSGPVLMASAGTTRARAGFVHAGPDGAEWVFPGGARLRAEPRSEVRVLSKSQPLTLTGGRQVAGYTVIVRAGHVDVEIGDGKARSSALILALPRKLNAIVQSGEVRAAALPAASAVAVTSGETTATVGSGAYRAIPAGSCMETSNVAAARIHPLIDRPTWLRGGGVWFVGAASQGRRELAWDAVDGARGYRIELAQKSDPKASRQFESVESRLSASFGTLATGEYDLRVFAVDALGLRSALPRSLPVRVVGASIPPGAYVDADNVIRLAPTQKVTLTGAHDVEISYGKLGRTFRVRGRTAVGLYRNEPTFAHFRIPGSHTISTLKLAPRTLEARVVVGPKTVTWPAQPVDIRIDLVDRSGAPIPDWVEAIPRVRLGLKEIDVKFRRTGRSLHGRVPQQPGRGPWVVRVDVADQFGLPLGRDFVEVIRDPSPRRTRVVGEPERSPDKQSRAPASR